MNILVATIQLPWPLDSGGKVALYSSFACLRNDHRFTVVCPVWDKKGLEDTVILRKHFPEIKFRTIYCGPQECAVQDRRDLLLRSLHWGARQYQRLRFGSAQRVGEQQSAPAPTYPFYPLPDAYLEALSDELSQGIDLVQAEFAEMLSLGPWLPPEIPKLFIHHQLHFVYVKRFSAVQERRSYSEYLETVMRTQEEAYLRSFDGVVVFSEEDKRALDEWVPRDRIHVSPFPIAKKELLGNDSFRSRFTFVGSEKHFPNLDGLEWLTNEIWSLILTQCPDGELKVIGPWTDSTSGRLVKSGIEFMGFVPDLEMAMLGSILLVPVRIGSGIRVKLLEAMSLGIPAVSTSIGCEGIPVTDGVNILIRDNASDFAAAAVELLTNHDLRARMAKGGKELVTQYYSPEQVRKRRNEIYQTVCRQASNSEPAKHEVTQP